MPDRIAHRVLAVGTFPSELDHAIAQITRRELARLQVDELGALSNETRVLLVGEGHDEAELHSILLAVRERQPSLMVVAVNTGEVAQQASFADWSYQFPSERSALLERIEDSVAPRFRVHASSLRMPALLGAGMLFALALWFIITHAGLIPAYMLPPPEAVFLAFVGNLDGFLSHTAVTAGEALVGYVLGNVLGVGTAIVLFRYRWVRSLSLPWLTGFQAIPIVALAPLLSVWLGTGFASKAVMAAIVCYFPIVSNVLSAFGSVDRDWVRLFDFHRARFGTRLAGLLLPASFPALLSALRISGGLAVVGAIVAEFTGSDRGLGYLLLNATYRLEIDRLFVAIFLSAVLGVLFANLPSLARLSRMGRTYAWE